LFKGISKKEEEKKIEKILKLRGEITSLLKNQNKTILVIIDDVDRLTANEIQDLFRALKAVANFPKMIYLLAYDSEVVVEAFENQTIGGIISKGKGREYLEKIVQLSLPLPPPKTAALDTFMHKNLDEALGQFDAIYYDFTHWTWITEGGINHFINTPRKVKRLANSLKIHYPPVKNEVNVIDFIAVEVLKQNVPGIYQKIRDNPHILLDDRTFFFGYTLKKPEELQKQYFADLLEGVSKEDKDAVIRIVINLFPDSRPYLDPNLSHFHFDKKEIRRARICSTIDNFIRYFRFELSENDFSNYEISWLLSVEWNCNALLSYLSEQFDKKNSKGISRLSLLLEKISIFINNDISMQTRQVLLNSIFNLEDRMLTNSDNSHQMFGPQNILSRITSLVFKLLELFPPEERSEILKSAFQEGTSIPILTECLAHVGRQHGRYQENASNYSLVPIETLNDLEQIWLEKIRTMVNQDIGRFFSLPNLYAVIFVWQGIPTHESEAHNYIQRFLSDDGLIIQSITRSRMENNLNPINPFSLIPSVDAVTFKSRVKEILVTSPNLNEDEKTTLTNFIKDTANHT